MSEMSETRTACYPRCYPAFAAGLTNEFARVMGNSIKMIQGHYGTLIDTAYDGILTRVEAVSL